MMFKPRQFLFLLIIIWAGCGIPDASARIIHVPGEVETIKAGVSAAEDGDTVMVAVGTYYGTGNRDIDFGGKPIVIRSMKGANLTILDCQGSFLSPHRGFHAHQGEDSTSIIEGFTIINGYAPFNAPEGQSIGGGILCQGGSSPIIKDCVMYGNCAASAGGGLGCVNNSSPTVIQCTFIDNSTIGDTAMFLAGYGGGIRCHTSSPVFRDCTIASNRANVGGGLSCNDAHPVFENCQFISNTADIFTTFEPAAPGYGGGAHFFNSSAVFEYCVLDGNIALTGPNMSYSSAEGGGIASYNSSLTLTNCTIYGNLTEEYGDGFPGKGAGLFLFDSPTEIYNSIIAYNKGAEAIGCPPEGCSDTLLPPVLACTDIFGNELGDWTDSIAGQEGINGNFSLPPYFCDPDIGNLDLWEYSSCLPDSNECGIQIGAYGAGCLTDVDDDVGARPITCLLSQNRPNPFNQSTLIEYTLAEASHVEITIYNTLGQIVRRLVDSFARAGRHSIIWDGRDDREADVATGLYFYAIRTPKYQETKRMILIK